MPSEGERLATLEAQREDIIERLDSQDGDLRAIRKDVHEIKEAISNYKGFVSGMIFAVASLAGLIGAGLTLVWHKLYP